MTTGDTELLVDSFEEEFYAQDGDQHVIIPDGWHMGYDGSRTRPEWKPKVAPDPLAYTQDGGKQTCGCHVRFAVHDAWLYRTIPVTKGSLIKAKAMVMLDSHPQSAHGVQIGFDPEGCIDPREERIAWSRWWATHDPDFQNKHWFELSVEALASQDCITIFLHTKNDWSHDLSAAHFDLVQVEYVSGDGGVTKADLMVLKAHVAAMDTKLNALMEGMG